MTKMEESISDLTNSSDLLTYHDLPQGIAFGSNIIHQHFIGRELILYWQRVVLTLLNFLEFNTIP